MVDRTKRGVEIALEVPCHVRGIQLRCSIHDVCTRPRPSATAVCRCALVMYVFVDLELLSGGRCLLVCLLPLPVVYLRSCLFCCCPIGLFAIFISSSVNSKWQRGDFDVSWHVFVVTNPTRVVSIFCSTTLVQVVLFAISCGFATIINPGGSALVSKVAGEKLCKVSGLPTPSCRSVEILRQGEAE